TKHCQAAIRHRPRGPRVATEEETHSAEAIALADYVSSLSDDELETELRQLKDQDARLDSEPDDDDPDDDDDFDDDPTRPGGNPPNNPSNAGGQPLNIPDIVANGPGGRGLQSCFSPLPLREGLGEGSSCLAKVPAANKNPPPPLPKREGRKKNALECNDLPRTAPHARLADGFAEPALAERHDAAAAGAA